MIRREVIWKALRMDQVATLIAPKRENVLYAIMIEHHNHADEKIPVNDGTGADIIRITFRRNEWEEAKPVVRQLISKGYKVCVQPVGTATYDDWSLLKLINDVNEIKPYAFYLVDTLGMMYRHDMRHFFYLIDNNLSRDICLGFHSHNNLQMSFANAQEMVRLVRGREVIVDTSCYGMGRGVGNLATELFADYINMTVEYRYSLTPILNIVDKYLMPIYADQRWGYDLPFFLAATVKCHPNYAVDASESFLLKSADCVNWSIVHCFTEIPPTNEASICIKDDVVFMADRNNGYLTTFSLTTGKVRHAQIPLV